MPDGIRWVGLDVHARASMVAIFDQATGVDERQWQMVVSPLLLDGGRRLRRRGR